MVKKIQNLLFLVMVSLSFGSIAFGQSEKDQKKPIKITAEEIVAKHLVSIGTPEALAAAKSRVFVGNATLSSKVGSAVKIGGPVQFAAEGEKVLLAILLNSNEYPYEKVGYDGKDLTTGRPSGGISDLASFLKANKGIVKEGLFGGVLSSAWPLLKLGKNVKLELAGIADIGGRPCHKLKFSSSGIGGATVTLYFDSENFRHVLPEYNYNIPPRLGSITTNSSQQPTYFTLTERFSNFTKAGDLTVPLTYVIDVSSQGPDQGGALTWTMNFLQAYYNEQLEVSVFRVS